MKKENWLELVTRADAEQFAYNHMNIEKLSMLGEFSDFSYGKYIGIEGFTKDGAITKWGIPKKHIALALGEYGPVDVDPFLETTTDDMKQLFDGDEELINIYLAWVMLVAEKNAGRKIDGKTYLESFSNVCESHIDLVKSAQIKTVENAAQEKKNCVNLFVRQIAPKAAEADKQPSNN